jgi:hypothetical protein
MQLHTTKGCTKRAWIDSDDLQDLDKLFDYVGDLSDNCVALWSDELLCRPWCMGELTTARWKGVPFLAVRFPGVEAYDDTFVEQYASTVNIDCLLEHGIDAKQTQDTLLWLRTQIVVDLPWPLSTEAMHDLATAIITLNFDGDTMPPTTPSDPPGGQSETSFLSKKVKVSRVTTNSEKQGISTCTNIILMDNANHEAVASALILRLLLLPRCLHNAAEIPHLLFGMDGLPEATDLIILFCSNGVFLSTLVLGALLTGAEKGWRCLPMLSEEGFRFPSDDMLSSVRPVAEKIVNPADSLLYVIKGVFKEIAVVFQPQLYSSTVKLLEIKASETHTRMLRPNTHRLRLQGTAIDTEKSRNSGGELTSQRLTSEGLPLPGKLLAMFDV